MKFIKYYMAQSKSSKRTCSSLDTDSDSDNVDSAFPHFIVLESLKEKPLSKVNPFVVEKVISGVVKPVSVKKNCTMVLCSLRLRNAHMLKISLE